MSIPSDLTAALGALPEDPRFRLLEGWTEHPDGILSFKFEAQLSAAPTDYVPEWTSWHLTLEGSLPDPDIDIFPDATDGIAATFQHQDNNVVILPGCVWRQGKPCLSRPAAVFKRADWAGEPRGLAGRIIWLIGRLFDWIDAAAENRLVEEGDPLELPSFPAPRTHGVLGFCETLNDLNWWESAPSTWGFATILKVPGADGTSVLSEFMDPQRHRFRRMEWSPAIPLNPNRIDAIWMVLPALVVVEPWQAPTTWAELNGLCKEVEVELGSILVEAGARLRHFQRPKHAKPVDLLIGFPMAERVGDPPERFHWIAIRNVALSTRDQIRKGFRSRAEDRRSWDLEFAMSARPIEWRKTANWAPDQLRKRGEAEDEVRSKSMLIIGAGSLGSAVAENLLRMGVTNMGILDAETLEVGNLSRHQLTIADTGKPKAVSMAAMLNLAAPDASVKALPLVFPPDNPKEIDELDVWDVIVDCSGSDDVLRAMRILPWKRERVFVTLAMTWEAKSLFAYTASETAFPAVDAIERFAAVSPAPEEERIGEMEGIGCWHPIFPATADDVNLWAAVGSKFVRRAVIERQKMAALFTQSEDGSVDRIDA